MALRIIIPVKNIKPGCEAMSLQKDNMMLINSSDSGNALIIKPYQFRQISVKPRNRKRLIQQFISRHNRSVTVAPRQFFP